MRPGTSIDYFKSRDGGTAEVRVILPDGRVRHHANLTMASRRRIARAVHRAASTGRCHPLVRGDGRGWLVILGGESARSQI